MESFVSEHGEGKSFFGVDGNAKRAGGQNFYARGRFCSRRRGHDISCPYRRRTEQGAQLAANCAPRVSIKVRTMPCETCHERVDEHIAGTGIEGEHVRRLCVCGDDGEIRDAADVQRDATEFCVPPKKVVDIGHEWSAL